jgi:hypothetical protein
MEHIVDVMPGERNCTKREPNTALRRSSESGFYQRGFARTRLTGDEYERR